jgi:exonuclease III
MIGGFVLSQLEWFLLPYESEMLYFSWNVWGLNDHAKRESVRHTILSTGASIVCLQETKISSWSNVLLKETVGAKLANQTFHLPSLGASGGILIAADSDYFDMVLLPCSSAYSLSVRINSRLVDEVWDLMGVYLPQLDNEKMIFLSELRNIQTMVRPEWVLLGEFNMIRRAREKNKGSINRRVMRQFNSIIDDLYLLELDLTDRAFTWSNEQVDPTMTRIDRFFATTEWHDLYPSADLHSMCTMTSDHCPLLMQGHSSVNFYRGFRFESFWPQIEGFNEVVHQAWNSTVNTDDAILRLHVKMTCSAKALLAWRRNTVGNFKVQMAIIQIILTLLEKAQEIRQLSSEELEFRRTLKIKILDIASAQRSCARQHSRLTWMRLGDANTKFFHLAANNRRRKNLIRSLIRDGTLLTSQEDKMNEVQHHFGQVLGTTGRSSAVHWDHLGYAPFELSELDNLIDDSEIKDVVMGLQYEKAPGLDGFIGLFYKCCFELIKNDLSMAINDFFQHRSKSLHLVNEANIILIPKGENADRIDRFRPISLINSFMKIITKIMANRLAPRMNEIISNAQNAFIQNRSIHDNFIYMQRVIMNLHKKR